MGIKAGSGKGGVDRGGSKGNVPGGVGSSRKRDRVQFPPPPPKKPLAPVESPFPENPGLRLGQYRVLEEKDDYLLCTGFDPNAKMPGAEVTPSAFRSGVLMKVAKPPALQRTVWEAGPITVGGVEYTYTYASAGVRTATWTDGDGDHEETQRIDIPYVVDGDIGDIIVAVQIKKNAWVEGMEVTDEDGTRLRWIDLNVSGRHWKGPSGSKAAGGDIDDETGIGGPCECPEGVTIPNATVCCKSHLVFEADELWPPDIDRKFLYKPNDEWSTDPAGFDDPETCDDGMGGSAANKYMWVRIPSHTLGADRVELQLVEDNGCPVKCVVYKELYPLRCQCAQEFILVEWNNISAGDVPCTIRLTPRNPLAGMFEEQVEVGSCISLDGQNVLFPGGMAAIFGGFSGWQQYYDKACSLPPGVGCIRDAGGGYYGLKLDNANGKVDVNGIHVLNNSSNIGGGAVGEKCTLSGYTLFGCTGYGTFKTVGTSAVIHGAFDIKLSINTGLYRVTDTSTGEMVGIVVAMTIEVPRWKAPLFICTAPPTQITWQSEVLPLTSVSTQADLDAIFDNPIIVTRCLTRGCLDEYGDDGDLVIPDNVALLSLSSAVLVGDDFFPGPATDDGSCGAPCEAPAADVNPAGCCCYQNQTFDYWDETLCTSFGGTWSADCSKICNPEGVCCLNGECFVAAQYPCEFMRDANGDPAVFVEGGDCATDPCSTTGACCVAPGGCTITTEADCQGSCEYFNGIGTTCDPTPCDSGACCSGTNCNGEGITWAFCCSEYGSGGGGVEFYPGQSCAAAGCNT